MHHLYDADSGTELAIYLLADFGGKFENSEAFLSADWEIGLVLVEGYVDYLLLLHFK